MNSIVSAFRSQYHSSLAMLEQCLRRCPADQWNEPATGNRFWLVSYHALYFVALYLSSEEDPVLWPGCRDAYHDMPNGFELLPGYDAQSPLIYSREEILDFIQWSHQRVDECFYDASVDGPSQFSWISFSRFEVHIYNLRHLQHHCGQLAERIKSITGQGVAWVGKRH